jgi:acetylornithine deacetylase/succinyl-diaminopimelate desuccinylase-like protein
LNIPDGIEPRRWRDTCGEATALLQRLLRIDTTNPPGNEVLAARDLAEVLAEDGLECEIIEAAPGRANLICRLVSGSDAPPLLLAGHLDVVPAGDCARWTHPPFAGELAGGMIWGRGALDMKNMVAMSAMVMKLLARREVPIRRDVILTAVADEEAGCTHGSRFLVEQHPEKVRAGYALGEVGGFPIVVKGRRVCVVQTAEKGICWLRLTATGASGHGSVPMSDSSVLRLCRALERVGRGSLPLHDTPVARAFVLGLAELLPLPDRLVLKGLLSGRLSPLVIKYLISDQGQARNFHALLHNTVSPTVLRAGEAQNVIPDSAYALLDGRLLPGQTARELVRELRLLLDDDQLEIEVTSEAPATINHPPDSELWDTIIQVVKSREPELEVLPYMIPGFTDGSWFSRLGARWYGFSPVMMDPERDPSFSELFHGIDERIPEDGFHWGLGALWEVVRRFAGR